MLALALYRDITGTPPLAKTLRVTAPLLPVNAAISAARRWNRNRDWPAMARPPGPGGLEPLVKALPEPDASGEMDPARPALTTPAVGGMGSRCPLPSMIRPIRATATHPPTPPRDTDLPRRIPAVR